MKVGLQCLLFILVAPGFLYTPPMNSWDVSITKNNAVVIFPRYIKFQLEVNNIQTIQSATLIYGVAGPSCQPSTSRQEVDLEPDSKQSAEWQLEFERGGMIPPGAEIWWQWEITNDQGELSQTEKKSITIQDDRFEWHRLERDGISVQWYQGQASFGQSILQLAEGDLHRLSSKMDIQPTKKIRIIVYASQEEMLTALVKSDDWVGAIALPDYSSILLGLAPTELSDADYYIAHELTHLVVEELTFNCMGVELPTWLSEGLAENAQEEPDQEEVDAVILAFESRDLPALNEIAGRFSADKDRARLEYTQSYLVVKYLLQTYGAQKMNDLLANFQSGQTADEALQKVYSLDTVGIDLAWRKSLGFSEAAPPPVKQPTRAPVPTLALWTAVVHPTGTPTPTPEPAATRTAIPTESPATPVSAELNGSATPKQSPIPSCVGILIMPVILYLFYSRKKESVS